MGDYWGDNPSRIESIQRAVRDATVHGAMGTHSDRLKGEIDQRLVNEIANLAVHTALLQYSTYIATEIARIESAEKMRMEEAMLRPSPKLIADFLGNHRPD